MKQLTEEQAIQFLEAKLYKGMTYRQRAEFQVLQDRLCMPFNVFHKAITEALGRPVYTHEFAYREELKNELYGEKPTPALEDILNLIPESKRIIIMI